VKFHVTQALGIDDLILDLLDKRIEHCVGSEYVCEKCAGTSRAGK
jgi:hypothetical protein